MEDRKDKGERRDMTKSMEGNNGCMRSPIISEQSELPMTDSPDVPATAAPASSLQVRLHLRLFYLSCKRARCSEV